MASLSQGIRFDKKFLSVDIFKILKISRICKLSHIDNTDFIVIFIKHIINWIR